MTDFLMEPTISFHALAKAAETIEPFVQLYFPFHKLSVDDFLPFLPVFVYTEATIYQIDEEYERHIDDHQFQSRHFEILLQWLEQKKLLDEEIRRELDNGLEYYRLEKKMCNSSCFSQKEIAQANRYKCYDFQILHRLLFQLQKKTYREDLLKVFRYGEMIVDVEDDIKQYSEDIRSNVYNIYRMMVKLHGKEGKRRVEQYKDELYQKFQKEIERLPEADTMRLIWQNYRKQSPEPVIPKPIIE